MLLNREMHFEIKCLENDSSCRVQTDWGSLKTAHGQALHQPARQEESSEQRGPGGGRRCRGCSLEGERDPETN